MLLRERPSLGTYTAALGEESTLPEIFDAGVESMRYVSNINAGLRAGEDAYDAHIDRVEKATGIRLANPYRVPVGSTSPEFGIEFEQTDPFAFFKSELERLAEARPEHRAVIAPERDIGADAGALARTAEHRLSDALGRRTGVAKWGAAFAGGFRGMLEDPVNVATAFIGPAGSVGTGARAVLWMGVKQGLANAAVEAASQPIVQSWRKKAGLEYGLSQAALDVAIAGGFGFGLDAGGRALFRGGRAGVDTLRGRTVDQAADDAARAMSPTSIARKAADGDPDALHRMAKAVGVADDPAMRGARAELELDIVSRIPPMDVDDGEHLARLAQAVRHTALPEREPPPGDAIPVPEASAAKPSLADDAPPPLRSSFQVEGKAVTFGEVPAARIVTDAATFQFKSGGDAAGATGRLAGVERWDPVGAGRVVVFERSNGELVIADGHQRLALAKRLEAAQQSGEAVQRRVAEIDREIFVRTNSSDHGEGAPGVRELGAERDRLLAAQPDTIKLQAFTFREADGWTPADVRALAAKKNLQEGTGTVVDAARVMRERPDIVDQSMPLGNESMRQARSLARLSEEAFGMVAAGVLPPNQAALVGDLVSDAARHAGMIADLAKAELDTVTQARLMVGEMLQVGQRVETQMTLLGEMTSVHSLLPERVRVLDAAMKVLRSDARIFALLKREESRIEDAGNVLAGDANAQRAVEAERLAELMTTLGQSRGPVSTWLNEAAEGLAGGKQLKTVSAQLVAKVRDALEREGLAGLMADVGDRELKPAAMPEATGKEAQMQIDDLFATSARVEPEPLRLGSAPGNEAERVAIADTMAKLRNALQQRVERQVAEADAETNAAALVKECKT